MLEALSAVLEAESRVAYALVFGSSVKAAATRPDSDVDVAIGLTDGPRLGVLDLGGLASRLEAAAGRPVDLVLLEDAPPGLAYRVFRDGLTVFVRDKAALDARLARAVLEYLDFRPVEDLCVRGVLAAAHGR
jgi:predicted nucleotidyltransferase